MNPTLFDVPDTGRVRASDPQTSVEAARAVDAVVIRTAILAEFRLMAWLTDDELADNLPQFVRESVKTARSGLKADGLVEPTGVKRPSNHGRPMIVWRLR